MIIAKNDEAKRSQIWRVVTFVSSVLIVVIAIYFLIKMFTTNPLDGTWIAEDGNYVITVKNSSSLVVTIPDMAENENIAVTMDYALNKEEKMVSIKQNEKELQKTANQYKESVTPQALGNALSPITTTFDYSVDRKKLTLTEREYGEQIIFIQK